MVPQSRGLYEWMRDGGVPKNSNVLRLCGNSYFLTGYDMAIEPVLVPQYYETLLDETAIQNRRFLMGNGIEFVTAGQSCAVALKLSHQESEVYMLRLQQRLNELVNEHGFAIVAKTDTEVLMKVN